MSHSTHRLALLEKVGYSLGDAAANLVWRGALAFLAVFYTDTYGLETMAVAALLLVVRLSDGVTDIIMGMVADRTETRWGKFRPWVLFSAPLLGIFMALTFTTPDLSPTGKLVYAYVTYICLTLAYTMNNVPYSALMGVMTPSNTERTNLSSWRFAGAFFGGFLVMVGTPVLVQLFGQGNEQLGYQYTMYLFSLLLVILLIATFKSTTERVSVSQNVSSKTQTNWLKFCSNMLLASVPLISATLFFYYRNLITGILFTVVIVVTALVIRKLLNKSEDDMTDAEQDIVDLLTNKPWLVLLGIGFLFMMFNGIKIGAAAYYFKHYVSDSISIGQMIAWWPTSIINIEGKEAFLSFYFAALLSISVVAALMTGWLVKLIGKKRLFISILLFGGLLTSLIFYIGPEDLGMLFGLGIASEFFAAIMPVLFFAMLGDAADYSEWKNKRRATGLVFSAGTFINKTGGGFAGALIVIVLGVYGYVGTDESTIELALPALKSLMSWIPGIFAVIAALLMILYPLNDRKMLSVESDLIDRRKSAS
ncbi:MAG: MFS transporter [Kangiellaceae bacterium]|nr:MFS transporter [Kangiellaceae bacterium]